MKRKNESLEFSRHVQKLERKKPDKLSCKKLPGWLQEEFIELCKIYRDEPDNYARSLVEHRMYIIYYKEFFAKGL